MAKESVAAMRYAVWLKSNENTGAQTSVETCGSVLKQLGGCVEQAGFQKKLVENVAALVADARSFRIEWEAHGPMVPGLDPMQAVERLKKFQQPFEARPVTCDLRRSALHMEVLRLSCS